MWSVIWSHKSSSKKARLSHVTTSIWNDYSSYNGVVFFLTIDLPTTTESTNHINNYWTNHHSTWGYNWEINTHYSYINIHYNYIKQQLEDKNHSWWSRQKSDFACYKGWEESISSYRWVRSTLRWNSHASHADVNSMCKVGFGNYTVILDKRLISK